MEKIKVTADTVLKILTGIMSADEINTTITDSSAPTDWQGKTVQEILNVEYYTFKHRPIDTETLVKQLIRQGQDANSLQALTRAFCILSLGSVTRVFSKDTDTLTLSASLEYWLQTDKVKLLEDMFDDIAVETSGIRVPVQIGTQSRQVVLAFGGLSVTEIEENTEFGEMAVVDVEVELAFYPPVVSRADYTAEFFVTDADTNTSSWVTLPFTNLSISSNMNQKSVPEANKGRSTGTINLSRSKTFTFTFDGYVNEFIDNLTATTYESDYKVADDGSLSETTSTQDNNENVILRLTRGEDVFYYNLVVKGHTITVGEDGCNETHSLTLTTRGMK